MSNENNRHVVPNSGRGGWDVVAPDATRASSHHNTQAEAQAAARAIVHNQGGGEVVTRDRRRRVTSTQSQPRPVHSARARR